MGNNYWTYIVYYFQSNGPTGPPGPPGLCFMKYIMGRVLYLGLKVRMQMKIDLKQTKNNQYFRCWNTTQKNVTLVSNTYKKLKVCTLGGFKSTIAYSRAASILLPGTLWSIYYELWMSSQIITKFLKESRHSFIFVTESPE